MSKTLVISGHPDYKQSLANRAILDEFHRLVPHAEIVYLDALYPDYKINAEEEQRRLLEADTIVFDFPIWWYSAPSLMHAYFEQVLTHGFAYGSAGTALRGKKVIFSYTVGASEEDYSASGRQGHALSEYAVQFKSLANLCGLVQLPDVVSYGMMLLDPTDKDAAEAFYTKARIHADILARSLDL